MDDAREIQCGGKRFTVKRFPDGVLGIFDPTGRMVVGWPETTVFGTRSIEEGGDDEWCALLARVRKIA